LFDAIVTALGVDAMRVVVRDGDAPPLANVRPLSILLAEDNLANQKLAIGVLTKQGHQVTVAGTGREAVQKWGSQPYDLILMDVQMPEMDGLEATRAIRQLEQLSGAHITIVAMTAHAMTGDRERCLESGMDEYLSKPIRARQIADKLAQLFPSGPQQEARVAVVTESPAPSQLIDWDHALEGVDGDHQLLAEVISAFLETLPQSVARVGAALEKKESDGLAGAAHSLKGELLAIGATVAAESARLLESAGKESDLSRANAVFVGLQQQLTALREPLAAFCKQHRS
jgi:CheY-like chemotaxis protein/HPt (histidine-containing phosphotransfer) domain-containing protein